MYRCRGSSHTATVLGYSYNYQTAVCTDTCPNQLMKFCPCNGVMRRLASRFRTRKTCSKRHSLPPNKHGGFVATQCHVRCDVMPSSRIPLSRSRSRSVPGVVAGSRTLQISNITDPCDFKVRTHHKSIQVWILRN